MVLSSTKAWLERLVAHETVSRDSNLTLIHEVAAFLAERGAHVELIHNEDGRKANCLARLGPERAGGIVLSGHTDVVPVDGQSWSTNPFEVHEEGGRLYGRGVCDMKGFLASALATLPTDTSSWRYPLWLALSYDEEVGCIGAPSMIERLKNHHALKPRGIIVGEPTELVSIVGHKGIAAAKTTVRGYETHSSQMNRGVSAVMVAARLMVKLESLGAELREAKTDGRFSPGYSTVHVGLVEGGTAVNITAKDASFTWDVRTIPGQRARDVIDAFERFAQEEVLPEMLAKHAGCAIHTELLADAPGLNAPGSIADSILVETLKTEPGERYVSYATEAGQFQAAGFDAVIWGPGSIDQAHQPDEWVSMEQLDGCDSGLRKLHRSLQDERG